MTLQYFIKCETLKTGQDCLYTNVNNDAVCTNFVDMALAFAKDLSTDWPCTRYTVLRYVDGLPDGDCGYYENGYYFGAGETRAV